MKKLFIYLSLYVFIIISSAKQNPFHAGLDSLKWVAANGLDTAKVMALANLGFRENDPVKRLTFLTEALELTRKINFKKGEAQCFLQLGHHFAAISDYSKALEYYLKCLKLREDLQNYEGIESVKMSIGSVYISVGMYQSALSYHLQAAEALNQCDNDLRVRYHWINLYAGIGKIYEAQNCFDSALKYYNRSYEYAILYNQNYLTNPLIGLGNVHAAIGNYDLAFVYYRESVAWAQITAKNFNLATAYLKLSDLFAKINNRDSAISYAKKALIITQDIQSRKIKADAARQLAMLYEGRDDKDAARYYKIAITVNDSIFNPSASSQIQNLTFTEQERQREIDEGNLKTKEERSRNLQNGIIAVTLIILIILFLLFSYSIIANQRLIRFLGRVALLLVFEFVNLFIHPYMTRVTSDIPLLMLLVLVSIAAILIPAHHYLEQWLTNRLVDENNKIRLAAAKRTMAELQKNDNS